MKRSRSPRVSRSAAQGVACRYCGALAGQRCRTARGSERISCHAERHEAAALLREPSLVRLAGALVRELGRAAPPKVEGGSPPRQQWIADVLAVQTAFHSIGAMRLFEERWSGVRQPKDPA